MLRTYPRKPGVWTPGSGVIVVLFIVVVVPAYAETGVPPFQTNPPGGQDKYEPKGIVFARNIIHFGLQEIVRQADTQLGGSDWTGRLF